MWLSLLTLKYLWPQRRSDRDFFLVLKYILDGEARLKSFPSEALRHQLLRDALSRAGENETVFQQVADSLNTFVEIVHHQGFDAELMQCEVYTNMAASVLTEFSAVGVCLSNVARRSADPTVDAFDPNPMLKLASTVIQFNKPHSRVRASGCL
jgi:hypothetical protein